MNLYTRPRGKLACIVKACDILFSALNLSRGSDNSRPGADDFLPVFIFVVLRANVPHVLANASYIQRYRDPAGLLSK